jgi:hypothetical protein
LGSDLQFGSNYSNPFLDVLWDLDRIFLGKNLPGKAVRSSPKEKKGIIKISSGGLAEGVQEQFRVPCLDRGRNNNYNKCDPTKNLSHHYGLFEQRQGVEFRPNETGHSTTVERRQPF